MRPSVPSLLRRSLPRSATSSRIAFNVARPATSSTSSSLLLHRRPYSTPSSSSSSSTSSPPRTCWSCHQPCPPTTPLCSSCSAIQPVLPTSEGGPNLFQLLGLPEKGSFAIDDGALKLAFLRGSKDVHPDGFKGKGEVGYLLVEGSDTRREGTSKLTISSPFPFFLSQDRVPTRSTPSIDTQQGVLYSQGSSTSSSVSRSCPFLQLFLSSPSIEARAHHLPLFPRFLVYSSPSRTSKSKNPTR